MRYPVRKPSTKTELRGILWGSKRLSTASMLMRVGTRPSTKQLRTA